MSTSGAEAILDITNAVNGLADAEVSPEIGVFLQEGYLRSMVTSQGIDRSRPAIVAIEDRIRQANPASRTALGKAAVDNLVDAMESEDVEPNSLDWSMGLVEHGYKYALLIEDPGERSSKLGKLAKGALHLSRTLESADEPAVRAWAQPFLDMSVESAEIIKDPIPRSRALKSTAETAVGMLLSLPTEDSQHELAASGFSQTVTTAYKRALEAVAEEPNTNRRCRALGWTVQSMAGSAAKINRISPETSEQLIATSLSRVDAELSAYETGGKDAGISSDQKALNLVIIGSNLSNVIEQHYKDPAQAGNLRRQLVGQTLKVFKATGFYKDAALASRTEIDHLYDNIDFSSDPAQAAINLLDSDFDVAKQLFAISFHMGELKRDVVGVDKADEVLQSIQVAAFRRDSLNEAFDLYSLAYQLESQRFPGEQTADMKDIAANLLSYLPGSLEEEIALEEVDRQLVEFSIDAIAIDPEDNESSIIKSLHKLDQCVADPILKQKISEQVQALESQGEQRRRPATKLAGIAYEHWAVD